MSRTAWNLIKHSKHFYVDIYRRVGTVLLFSVILNIILGVLIHYLYLSEPEPDFYASDGITPPVKLTPLAEPNYTSTPLLPADVETEDAIKVIPQ